MLLDGSVTFRPQSAADWFLTETDALKTLGITLRTQGGISDVLFKPSATVSRIDLMESCTAFWCHVRVVVVIGLEEPPPWLADPPGWLTPPGWLPPYVMDGWGARPLR